LPGVISRAKTTKGVLVTRGGFTIGAHEFARHHPRIELVSGTDLVALLNEHLGTRWVERLERLVEQNLRGKGKKTGSHPHSGGPAFCLTPSKALMILVK
jgi:hypothetical protein